MDPAALGTAIIGLDHIRSEEEAGDHRGQLLVGPRREGLRGRWLWLRGHLAVTLRGVARRVDPAPRAS